MVYNFETPPEATVMQEVMTELFQKSLVSAMYRALENFESYVSRIIPSNVGLDVPAISKSFSDAGYKVKLTDDPHSQNKFSYITVSW